MSNQSVPSNADIRAGLMAICRTHAPSNPDESGVRWCRNDEFEWPCEAFRQALLNLQFERLFDLIRVMMGADNNGNLIIQGAINANPQKGQG